MNFQGQGHFLTSAKNHLHIKCKASFSQKLLDQSKQNFICIFFIFLFIYLFFLGGGGGVGGR